MVDCRRRAAVTQVMLASVLDTARHAGQFVASMTAKRPAPPLDWEETGRLLQGMSFASRPMHMVTREITEQYSLGPRGAWILVLIANGQVYPLDITNVFRIGRSLISAELARLTEAGLIAAVKNENDRRRTKLALTPLGEEVCNRVRDGLYDLAMTRLKGYSREEMLLCSRMLSDWYGDDPLRRKDD